MIDLKQLPEMAEELRKILSATNGAKAINETLSLQYVVEVEDDAGKESIQKVGMVLSAQAEKFGFTLDVIPATTEELKEAEKLMSDHLASQIKFKA